jgi:hypothetical protein
LNVNAKPRLLTARFWLPSDFPPAEADRDETDDWVYVSDQGDATAIEYALITSQRLLPHRRPFGARR